MSEPVIIALITVIGGITGSLLGALVGRDRRPDRRPVRGRAVAFLLGAGAALFLVLGGYAVVQWFSGSGPELSIVSPRNDATVAQQQIEVRGTWTNVTEADAPRLIVHVPEIGYFYPDAETLDLDAGGEWTARIGVGSVDDSGKRFDIIATTGNAEAQRTIEEYLDRGQEAGIWPGLPELPEGVIRHATATVVRQ